MHNKPQTFPSCKSLGTLNPRFDLGEITILMGNDNLKTIKLLTEKNVDDFLQNTKIIKTVYRLINHTNVNGICSIATQTNL